MRTTTTRQRVFLTFAANDVVRARPVAAQLLAGGDLALDQALTSEPFNSMRGEIVRASLLTRLRHCTSALCLYGAETTGDPWVRWGMETAAELRLPLFGAALPGSSTWESERFLARLGAELLPLDHEAIVEHASTLRRRSVSRAHADRVADTLHLMRHPLR